MKTLASLASIDKLIARFSGASPAILATGNAIRRILTLSPADDAISRKRALAISIERGRISVAYGSRLFSRIRIAGVKVYPLEDARYPSPEKVAETAWAAVRELKTAKGEICLGIPKEWVIIKSVELPASVKENLANVLSYELDRLTPLSADEAVYDFTLIEETQEKLRIAVAAAKLQLLKPYLNALQEKGLAVTALYPNLSGMAVVLDSAGQGEDALLLMIDERDYECASIRKGSISSACAGRLEKGPAESSMTQALKDCMALCEPCAEGTSRQAFVFLKGRLAEDGYPIFEAVAEKLKVGPFSALDSIDLKRLTSAEHISLSYPAAGIAIGSLWPKAAGLNLLSRGRRENQGYSFRVTATLGLILLCSLALFIVSPIGIEQRKLGDLERQITARKAEVVKAEALRKEIENLDRDLAAINKIKLEKPPVMDLVKELTTILPPNVWIARMRIADSLIEIEGYAAGNTSELLPLLEKSKYFQKVEFTSPTFRDPRMNADRFVIKMELEGVKSGDGKPETEKKV